MCEKRRHTRDEALAELHAIKVKHGLNRERRIYQCTLCGAWHLTSETYAPKPKYRRRGKEM